jgi:hypothetical protein
MLEPSLTTWKAQYDRLVRSRERVLQPYKSSVVYNDDLQHYFQDCWHLKDWIKNDPFIGVGKTIEVEVQAHKALQVIADLANAAKHLDRHTHRAGAYVTSTNVTVHLGQDKPIDVHYVVTLADGTTLSAQDLIHEGFRAWEAILSKLGLHP